MTTASDEVGAATAAPETVARRLLALAHRAGVEVIFVNLGSDHPAFIEAFSVLGSGGPRVVVCPHEVTALGAAHGYAMITRRPQMVLVHVDVGTANLGGSVHNAARSRVPAIIVAGRSPATLKGDLTGTRTEFIHFIQDTRHQHDIVRPYVKWSYDLTEPRAAEGILLRAQQVASSDPQGPVYLTGAREVWDKPAVPAREDPVLWSPARFGGIPIEAARRIAEALAASRRPLVITSYLGRNVTTVAALVTLSELVGIAVCEVAPCNVNFPGDHPNHLGYRLDAHVDEADLILLLDVDVPWLPHCTGPGEGTRIFHVDIDPLKSNLLHWHYPVSESFTADAGIAISQIAACLSGNVGSHEARAAWIASVSRHEAIPADAPLTEGGVAAALRELAPVDALFVVEDPSGTVAVWENLRPQDAGSAFGNGGTSLGWGLNAALGAKLARPDAVVVSVVGDGAFVFGVPTSVFWASHAYGLPILAVVCNNVGWKSPKLSTVLVHPEGAAVKDDTFFVTMTRGARLPEVANAAGDAAVFRVTEPTQLRATLQEAFDVVRAGRSAVVDIHRRPISGQTLR